MKIPLHLDEDALETDIKFLMHNRSETDEQFIDEAIALIKTHMRTALAQYQVQLIDDLSRHLRDEVVNVVVRSKFETDTHDW